VLETIPNGEQTLYMVLWLDSACHPIGTCLHAGGVMFERPRGKAKVHQHTVWDETDRWTALVVRGNRRTK